MSLYVDTSVLLKRYVDEPDSDRADELLASDPLLVTGRHTVIEVTRALPQLLWEGELAGARAAFRHDLPALSIVELDATTCDLAASIAEATGARTLDALHLAAAQRVGGPAVPFLTFDVRQAQLARSLGFSVVGA